MPDGIVGNFVAKTPSKISCDRGRFDEIISLRIDGESIRASTIISKFAEALPDTFVQFDSKMRGDALNHDLYGYDPEQDVAIIQIRHAFRQYRYGFMNVRKTYVLCGFNEITKLPFRHPVGAHAVRAAIRKDEDDPRAVVRAAQRWMWGVTEKQLAAGIRQGDVLIVPHRGEPAGEEMGRTAIVGESHEIRALRIIRGHDGRVYAHCPSLWHTKGQHDPVAADRDGWYSIRVADEASSWRFGERLGD